MIEHRDRDFGPLFGLFDDSLPDGWGLLLMDRFFARVERETDPILDQVLDAIRGWPEQARRVGVGSESLGRVQSKIEDCAGRLGG